MWLDQHTYFELINNHILKSHPQYLIIPIFCPCYLLFINSTFSITTFAFLPVPVPHIIYSDVLSLLNAKKVVRIKQLPDVATIVLKKHYHAGLNKIKYDFPSPCSPEVCDQGISRLINLSSINSSGKKLN